MKHQPLFRTKLSNERLMTALVLVLLLYNLPRFIRAPGSIPEALLLIALGLIVDAVAHYLLYRRPACAVSAAVTALVLFSLSPGATFAAAGLALAASLIVGKLIWGGTGKNPLNPAMLGLCLLAFIVRLDTPTFEPTLLLLPAIVLSLPFLFVRPFAGAGMIAGMAAALLLRGGLSVTSLISNGVFFWGCLVITDPVTTTARPVPGFIIGALAGFAALTTGGSPAAASLTVLAANILSYLADRLNLGAAEKLDKRFGKRQKIVFDPKGTPFLDLAGDVETQADKAGPAPDRRTILERLEKNGVAGCGGAAFPTVGKLRAAIECTLPEKHLVVNAAECDPGLIHDKWLLTHRRSDIAEGISLLEKCVPFKSVTVAAKDFFGAGFPPGIKLHKVCDFYPSGAEKLLIRDVLGIGLGHDELPSSCGILVLNVQTVIAVRDAVLCDQKADTRYLTAADLNSRTGTVVRVRLGADVHETAGTLFPNAVAVFTGGGAMDARLSADGDVIGMRTNFLAAGAVKGFREGICSRCDRCAAFCPSGLAVREIARLMDEGRPEKTARYHPEACIGCRLCSAVCPAGRDQAGRMETARKIKV